MALPINIRLNIICLWNRISKNTKKTPDAALQLRRAISIQADGKKLLKKHASAVSCKRLLGRNCVNAHLPANLA